VLEPIVRFAAITFYFCLLPTDYARTPADAFPLKTVQKVDLARYVGQWYEVARYPNRFERDCVADVTATYKSRVNGTIEVVNACRKKDGQRKVARGNAKVADAQTNAKLKVTFFWPFYGDYWVIVLDPDYKYAVVGEPARKYLWILSRTRALDDATYKKIFEQITASGYDISKLIKTPQNGDVTGNSND
jgi:apolipoprotein D and lipocalin family protein